MGLPPVQRLLQDADIAARGSCIIVGCDLDGVLGDQIAGVLPLIKRRLGIELHYEDITEFRLPLGLETDLAEQIEAAQTDQRYLLDMPPCEGAAELVRTLRQHYRVVLITARPSSSRLSTEEWLRLNGFEFDAIVNAGEAAKSLYGADVLIDDYTGNIEDFVTQTKGLGVLVDRPWNRRDRLRLTDPIAAGQVRVANALEEIPAMVDAFARHRYAETASSASG